MLTGIFQHIFPTPVLCALLLARRTRPMLWGFTETVFNIMRNYSQCCAQSALPGRIILTMLNAPALMLLASLYMYSIHLYKRHSRMNIFPSQKMVADEAKRFREILEQGRTKDIPLIRRDFPIMSCKLASLLFCNHLLKFFPSIIIAGVSGIAKDRNKEETISHYWLEIGALAVDITLDQFNLIEDQDLNSQIIRKRPFCPVYVGNTSQIPTYKLFTIKNRDKYDREFSEISEDFMDEIQESYSQLMGITE